MSDNYIYEIIIKKKPFDKSKNTYYNVLKIDESMERLADKSVIKELLYDAFIKCKEFNINSRIKKKKSLTNVEFDIETFINKGGLI